jgi:N-acyl-D-amino-acid deacylase
MRSYLPLALIVLVIANAGSPVLAVEPQQSIRDAIQKAIPNIEKGAAGSAKQKVCFTCHSQAVPIVALAEAKTLGFKVDEKNLAKQVKHTSEHLKRGKKNYLMGKGQGGRVLTAGYALWALESGGYEPDEITAAVTGYIVVYQDKKIFWNQNGNRPPSSGSPFANSYVALRGLSVFSPEEQTEKKDARVAKVREWLIKTPPKDLEDQAFRLRALKIVDAPAKDIQSATDDLLKSQRDDGGWAQTSEMKSDAYATSTALVALLEDGGVKPDHDGIAKGISNLLKTQQEDGSWHVVTRAKGFQKYFESGFPHGKDQFISIAASSWAVIALLDALEPEAAGETASTSSTE